MRRGVLLQAEGIAQGEGQKQGFPHGSDDKESAFSARDPGSILGLGRSWRREWQLTPVFLPGEFHGQRKGSWKATVHRIVKSWT